MPIGSLSSAVKAVDHVGKPGFRLLIDAMHFYRSGGETSQLAALAPGRIGHVQLCDVPMVSRYSSYGEEAKLYRMAPGDGELPLRDFLAALPKSALIGLEVPMLDRAKAGEGPRERLSRCIQATCDLMGRSGDQAARD